MAKTSRKSSASSASMAASAANVPGIPVFVDNGSGSVTLNWTANGNGSTVQYALYNNGIGYVAADGSDNGSTPVWQDLAAWGDVTVTGLSDYTAYTFKVKARNELLVESAFSADSVTMNTLPAGAIDEGEDSENLERTATGGNTRVGEDSISISGSSFDYNGSDYYYGDVTVGYTLLNYDSTDSRIVPEWSEDGAAWDECTEGSGGDGKTGLSTSPTGVSHEFSWDSYTDCGLSELDGTVYVRIRPFDVSPAGGDEGPTESSDAFGVNNRPAKLTWENNDGRSWDEDTTPVFKALLLDFRGGPRGFPQLTIYASDGTTVVKDAKSWQDIAGWSYGDSYPGTAMTVAGIPSSAVDGSSYVYYTVQAADALSVDPVALESDYIIRGKMCEPQDRG